MVAYSLRANLLLLALLAPGKAVAQGPTAPPTTPRNYAETPEGLQSQISDVIRGAHSTDQSAAQSALDSLGIPNANAWFALHFDQRFTSKMSQDYASALSKFQSHIQWIALNFAKFDDFRLAVQPSEIPPALSNSGFETLLPQPTSPVQVANYRFTSTSSDKSHGPPSFVTSFVFVDGQFRFVGGTYPFWAEGLSGLRGPMSIPPASIHGRTVQGIAYRKDQAGNGIDAVVQLKISVAHNGKVEHIKVLSGDEPSVQDAKDYVKAADFGALPNIPQLANATREWEFEVAFFPAK
jgi:hypothetical protein